MLTIKEIHEIIKMIDESSIEEFVYKHEGSKIEIKKRSAVPLHTPAQPIIESQQLNQVNNQVQAQPSAPVPTEALNEDQSSGFVEITSPMVGTFYQASSPDAPPYVEVGSQVKEDTIVCIVEAMKLFNEIEAEVEGEIVEVLVKDGQLVEYGQPLFLVKPR